jgi:UTP-glucose-1-phosphate uridylyltransferase
LETVKFSSVVQKTPAGDVDAIYAALWFLQDEPVVVFFCDDIILYKDGQSGFWTTRKFLKPVSERVIALKRLPKDKLYSYGVVEVEKIC